MRRSPITLAFLALLWAAAPATTHAREASDPRYESADAVFLEVVDEYTLHEDGSTTHRHEQKVRTLTPYAFSRILGETYILFDPTRQALEVLRNATTTPEGIEVSATPNSVNDILPGFCADAPPYAHLRERVVTHLGLDIGSVAHLEWEIRSEPGFLPWLMGEEVFALPHPIETKTVIVNVPREVPLAWRLLHGDGVQAREEAAGGMRRFTWTMERIAMAPDEPMAPEAGDDAPLLVFSTAPAWEEAASVLAERLGAAMRPEAGGTAAARARAIRRETTTDIDFVRAVERLVATEVATANVDSALLGYAPLPAEATFGANVGSPLDKAVLLAAMLRGEGIEAEPVLVSRRHAMAEDVPSWLQFGASLVAVSLPDADTSPTRAPRETLLLDPAHRSETAVPGDLEGRVLLFPMRTDAPLERFPESDANLHRTAVDLRLALDEENRLGGEIAVEVAGSRNPYVALVDGADAWAERCLGAILPGAEFEAIRWTRIGKDRSSFVAKTKTPAPLETAEGHDLREIELPDAPGGIRSLGIPIAPTTRTRALRIPCAMTEEVEIAIELPASLGTLALEPPRSIVNAAGTLTCEGCFENSTLCLRRVLTLSKAEIPPEEYPALRELLVEWTAPDARRIVVGPAR